MPWDCPKSTCVAGLQDEFGVFSGGLDPKKTGALRATLKNREPDGSLVESWKELHAKQLHCWTAHLSAIMRRAQNICCMLSNWLAFPPHLETCVWIGSAAQRAEHGVRRTDHRAAQHGAARHRTARHGTARFSTVQCQYNTVLHSTALYGVAWHVMRCPRERFVVMGLCTEGDLFGPP